MRQKMIQDDQVECVIGLGPNLFYNSPMEACLLITKTKKSTDRKRKILFINAVNEVRQEKTMGFLEDQHVNRIFSAYKNFETIDSFSVVVSIDEVLEKKGNMAINRYVRLREINTDTLSFEENFNNWEKSSESLSESMRQVFNQISI